MKRLGTTTRIAFAMAMWSAMVLLSLRLCGYLEDGNREVLAERTRLCETLAVSCSQFISQGEMGEAGLLLEHFAKRNPQVLSVACRGPDGKLQMMVGEHDPIWSDAVAGKTTGVNCIQVPVYKADQKYAQLEIAFESPVRGGLLGFFALPSIRVTLMASLLNLLGFSLWLRRCFRQMDPAKAVPGRVRAALDTMAEVVMVLDDKQRIMLANRAFGRVFERAPDSFQGQTLTSLPWEGDYTGEQLAELLRTIALPEHAGQPTPALKMRLNQDRSRIFKPNASQIYDETGALRGTLLSLDDITALEEKNAQLLYLATRDPMTGCLNRRSFFESFEQAWKASARYQHPLSCVMVDVDHFKSINDTRGHAMGDEVLKAVAATLLKTARETDLVCRYGGEEFCVLLPHVDLAGAGMAAERFRVAISQLEFPDLKVTASLGCSDRSQGAEKAESMLEQADQSLYHSKRNGRNRVTRFDQLQPRQEEAEQTLLRDVTAISAEAAQATTEGSAETMATEPIVLVPN